MENLIYRKLTGHLDNLPGGFPATETGVELHILKKLFHPEEAELALYLTLISEEPRVIARSPLSMMPPVVLIQILILKIFGSLDAHLQSQSFIC